jgi:hypothetical protein
LLIVFIKKPYQNNCFGWIRTELNAGDGCGQTKAAKTISIWKGPNTEGAIGPTRNQQFAAFRLNGEPTDLALMAAHILKNIFKIFWFYFKLFTNASVVGNGCKSAGFGKSGNNWLGSTLS